MIRKNALIHTVIMATLTIFFCLFLADGLLFMDAYVSSHFWKDVLPGRVVFFISIVVLTLLFHKKVAWKYTLINLILYFGLYFPVYLICDNFNKQGMRHLFMPGGRGFIDFPPVFYAIIVSITFWGLQSFIYFICFIIKTIIKTIRAKRIKSLDES